MPFPKVEDWSDEVYQAGTRGGFNVLRDLPRELQRAIPDLRNFKLGLCSETDLKEWRSMGWVHMTFDHLDYETINDFNAAIGLRFGLRPDVHSHITVGDNYIMIMPNKYREKVDLRRKEALINQREQAVAASAISVGSDPRADEMYEGALETAQRGTTRATVIGKGQPPDNKDAISGTPKKRGRPPKNS